MLMPLYNMWQFSDCIWVTEWIGLNWIEYTHKRAWTESRNMDNLSKAQTVLSFSVCSLFWHWWHVIQNYSSLVVFCTDGYQMLLHKYPLNKIKPLRLFSHKNGFFIQVVHSNGYSILLPQLLDIDFHKQNWWIYDIV